MKTLIACISIFTLIFSYNIKANTNVSHAIAMHGEPKYNKDFGNLISLTQNKKPIIGIINCPAHDERWIGVKNQKTTINQQIVKTSGVAKIEDALKVHDYMALVNVIEGAGGKITDKYGDEITTDSQGSVIASANEKLHSELISLINKEN